MTGGVSVVLSLAMIPDPCLLLATRLKVRERSDAQAAPIVGPKERK